jgi:hypothetical protein
MYNANDLKISIPLETSQGTLIPNYKVGDRDNSYVCNYSKCELKCNPDLDIAKLKDSDVDDSTYDSRFIIDDISLYQKYISLLFVGQKKAYTYEKIVELLKSNFKVIDEEVIQYALQGMIDDKTPLFDGEGLRGYLIYRSNKYIFQSFLVSDKRMTIEQREAPPSNRNRMLLNVSALKPVIASSKAVSFSSDGTSKHPKEGEKNASPSKVPFVKNVIEYIENEMNVVKEAYKVQGVNVSVYDDYIVDSLIDQLHSSLYIRIVQELAALYNKDSDSLSKVGKSCLRSLIDAGVLLLDKGRISNFYNYYDGEVYCLRSDNEFKRCTPLEYTKIAAKANEIKMIMTSALEDTIKGHTDNNGSGTCNFKVRDNPKSTGYVCLKTSSLSLSDLRERIHAVNPKFKLETMIKKDMCFLYELALRAQGKKVFKRSITKKLQ